MENPCSSAHAEQDRREFAERAAPPTASPFLFPSLPSQEGSLPLAAGAQARWELQAEQPWAPAGAVSLVFWDSYHSCLGPARLRPGTCRGTPDPLALDLPPPGPASGWGAKLLHQVWTNPKDSLGV